MLKNLLSNPATKKVVGVGAAVIMGVVTVVNTLADQKKDAEFETMKKTLEQLTKQQ